ncbi:hypothetical protein AVEN_117163-1 [Araneus ventricosus]|uniref:Uncharacterized protein n=1 Tax=Araneus ventricosus TaxID=182803 RepID=A0A4Y2AZX2_ARAVE|nr:hypothetical protein AVEN_117163-1 [Araneus ventricosus]
MNRAKEVSLSVLMRSSSQVHFLLIPRRTDYELSCRDYRELFSAKGLKQEAVEFVHTSVEQVSYESDLYRIRRVLLESVSGFLNRIIAFG